MRDAIPSSSLSVVVAAGVPEGPPHGACRPPTAPTHTPCGRLQGNGCMPGRLLCNPCSQVFHSVPTFYYKKKTAQNRHHRQKGIFKKLAKSLNPPPPPPPNSHILKNRQKCVKTHQSLQNSCTVHQNLLPIKKPSVWKVPALLS